MSSKVTLVANVLGSNTLTFKKLKSKPTNFAFS